MLRYLHLTNVGPAPEMEAELAPRINLVTGDNGLGKSFLLDIAWWTLTRTWPAKINTALVSGHMARPRNLAQPAAIEFHFDGVARPKKYTSEFDRTRQLWTHGSGRPSNPGLVLYAQVDGSFSLWDPARNYVRGRDDEGPEPPSAYVFTPQEVWRGLQAPDDTVLCNGLFADWSTWQNKSNEAFSWLEDVLKMLSPEGGEPLRPGALTRLGLDAREIPTIRMPYGQEIPVVHASAGIRRLLALAYLLVWSWTEHDRIVEQTGQPSVRQVIFLVDEIEAHLHPRWQRQILKPLLHIVNTLTDFQAQVQIVAATHSPLVAASMEPLFDPDQDAWFDLDLDTRATPPRVELQKRPFFRCGDVSSWLTSDAFDLGQARSLEAEKALARALAFLRGELPREELPRIDADLRASMPGQDPFWLRWRDHVDSLQAAP